MRRTPTEPTQVHVEVGGRKHPAEALELTGHRAAIRSPYAFELASAVRLVLRWSDGETTALPAVVRAVCCSGREHLAHVEVTGVEGAWEPFLALVGPSAAVA
jgi:hypothetical protein